MGVVLEDDTTDNDIDYDDHHDSNDDDESNTNSHTTSPRPKSLSARNLQSFSRDITGLAATLAARPSSRRLKRTRMLADLEDYNNVFSRRLSGGGTMDAAGRAGRGHGSAASVGSRATSRTNSCRTVSDLDVEPAADVERPSPSQSEDMSVDDENDFDSCGRGDGGGSISDGENGFRSMRGGDESGFRFRQHRDGVGGDGSDFSSRHGGGGGGVSSDGSGSGSRSHGGARVVSSDGGVGDRDDGVDASDDGGRIGGGGVNRA